MPSKQYKQNWDKANQWLDENAPDYVIECIKEVGCALKDLSKVARIVLDYTDEENENANTLHDELSKIIKRNKNQNTEEPKMNLSVLSFVIVITAFISLMCGGTIMEHYRVLSVNKYNHCLEICGEKLEGVYLSGNCLCAGKDIEVRSMNGKSN
ncbi:hypothetical protein LCGC14_2417350 [marine sediment metagenome]|uniref:Uncharacterized protein n=1 Tax=marine sediment metagenome TaxID=412755 RepID=A0A0F9BQS2_9ZZZZ